jgi:uncharacterized protein YprB with RNaseH-like and TPR domain
VIKLEIIKYNRKNIFDIPDVLVEFFDDHKFILFDIETTGLNPRYDKVILIGILYVENNDIFIEQFFCHNSKNEKKLLKTFKDRFNDFDFYITYNGGNFDIPFLNRRFLKNDIDYKIDPYLNLDLCRIVRKNQKKLGLNNCKLKTVEKFLNIYRKDTISGAKSVQLYKDYELTNNSKLKEKILLHNFEDILHLLPTLNILNYIDKDEIVTNIPKEFKVDNEHRFRIIDHKIDNDFLSVRGKLFGELKQDYVFYNQSYSYKLMKKNNEFSFKIPLLNINLYKNKSYTYIDLDGLDFVKTNLSEMNQQERNKYLIKAGKHINETNIYNFIKSFIYHILGLILNKNV